MNSGHHEGLQGRIGRQRKPREPVGFRRGRPPNPGPVLQVWATPRWAQFSFVPLTVFAVALGEIRGDVPMELACAWIVWPAAWWCFLRQRIELFPDVLMVKVTRCRWLPREELEYTQLTRGITFRPRAGRARTCSVASTRSALPGMWERAEGIRDAVNQWAGVTEPLPPAPEPPTQGWTHRTDTRG